jgi:hypothetical protein
VIINDRAADRQAHPHSAGLRREEGIEDVLGDRRIQPRPGVFHRNQDTVWCFAPRADPKPARAIGNGAHRFHPVHDQIEDNLLQLNPVTNRDGRRFCQFGSDNDPANAQLGVHDRECFAEQVIDIDPGSFRRRFI